MQYDFPPRRPLEPEWTETRSTEWQDPSDEQLKEMLDDE